MLQYFFERGTKNIHSHICKKITIFQQCTKRLFLLFWASIFFYRGRKLVDKLNSENVWLFAKNGRRGNQQDSCFKIGILGFFFIYQDGKMTFFSWSPHQKIKITCRRKIVHAHCRVQEKKIIFIFYFIWKRNSKNLIFFIVLVVGKSKIAPCPCKIVLCTT